MKHLFVIDPLPTLNLALDSSLRMMGALHALGHQTYVTQIDHLSWNSTERAAGCRCRPLGFEGALEPKIGGESRELLSSFAAIHMRKDPPFDMRYLSATLFLDQVGSRPDRPKVYNSATALRAFNEKLGIMLFPEATLPALASSSPEELCQFLESHGRGDVVVKPLDLFGGRGVERVTLRDGQKSEVLNKLRSLTHDGQEVRLIQAFDERIFEGEVRAFTVAGKALAWCLKKPKSGEFLANTRMGATLHTYEPSNSEVERVEAVARALLADGIFVIGFDLIGGYISEINVTSPRMLVANDNGAADYKEFAELICKDLERPRS